MTHPNNPEIHNGCFLDAVDRALLDLAQAHFPLVKRPYAHMGRQLGLTEAETLARVRALRGRGIIRRLGANFSSKHLGFISTLCAAKVPEDKLQAFTEAVNAHPGVTHNYLRAHEMNVWFTLIASSREAVEETLAGITRATGIPILNLPAARLYKIKVDFPMS